MTVNVATWSSPDHFSLRALISQVSGLLQNCDESAEIRVRRAGALLRDHTSREPIPAPRGGLPAWKIKKVTEYIDSHIGSSLNTPDLAIIAGLSPWHFCRAFRISLNVSPHGFVMRRRIVRSQSLMRTTRARLADIALECGFADQAHFSRVHTRLTGVAPRVWRTKSEDTPGWQHGTRTRPPAQSSARS